ncbi:hypothetical protein N0V85_003747 [Neurospora sp. IMI 360204]|nr:hypothetical protein N0V85_003747 [Neurospora sp. IMI 360204]
MSLTLNIPPEDHDNLLDERARSSDADTKRWWLLCRRLHLSKKFETDDGKFDSNALAKALSEVMARDRGDKDVPDLSRYEQHYLRDDREQERRLARERILKMTSQEMEDGLKQQLDFASWTQMVARAAYRAQRRYKNQKDKDDHLRSLRRLVVDLGRAITDCDSIQDYISVSNLLFWSTRGVLDLTIQLANPRHVGIGSLKAAVENFFMNYVVSVLLVESKAMTLSPGLPELEQGIPSEDFDKLLKDRLEIENTTISSTRKIHLFQKPSSYLTPDGKVDIESFAMVLAKGMAIDKQGSLPSLKEVLEFDGAYLTRKYNTTQRPGGRYDRSLQQQEGQYTILERVESEIMERLMGDGWIKSIMDRARIESDDLLSPKAMKEMTEKLAVLIRDQLKEGIQIVEKKPEDGEVCIRLTEVRPFIVDLGGSVKNWKDFSTYLRVSLYLFWATADTWWSLPTVDSSQEARKSVQSIAERFLRNYLALVLIGEAKPEAQKLEQSKAEQSSTDAAGAEGSKTEQSNTGDSGTPPVTYNIPPKPLPPPKPCCFL